MLMEQGDMDMLKIMAILFGIAFIFAGVAGFIPTFYINDLLLGYFEVNTMHNIIHIVSGVIAIMAATNYLFALWYFRIFGLVYGLVAILGFVFHGDLSFMMMHVNTADNILHVVIAIVALYLGFVFKKI